MGIPNELFWDSTPQELGEIFKRKQSMEKESWLRAGLIAATIINVNRRPGAALVQPGDFIREERREEDFMSVEDATKSMDRWAARMNASREQTGERVIDL